MKLPQVILCPQFHGALLVTLIFQVSLQAQNILVSSRNSNSVRMYEYPGGTFVKTLVTPGSGGLTLPQEVLLHPDGSLLVTGRGNANIKHYDTETGNYLGNFTSGYALDNPTKTTIHNGMLYVSQWGVSKNAVVRFDVATGAFIDEFTSIGVPNGGGHAWDASGNLYVAQYGDGGNGRVLKFDPAGEFIGTFINSALLNGPINLWFDASGDLFVVDWTLGDVLQFDGETGDYQSTLISGMSNLEGFTFDDSGDLIICDWTGNAVYIYNFQTHLLDPIIIDGSLQSPNSVLITMPASSVTEVISDPFQLVASPNPASDKVLISFTLKSKSDVRLEILNTHGQVVASVISGQLQPGVYAETWDCMHRQERPASPGCYYVRLQVDNHSDTMKIVLQ